LSTEKKVLIAVVAFVVLIALALLSTEVVEKEIAPKPRAAWVAIDVGDTGVAQTGAVEIESGTPFRLHAVVEAQTFSGSTIYYTEAERVVIDGEEMPSDSLRHWERSVVPRILWFSVEGYTPFLELGAEQGLEAFRFQDNFRADWPRTWSIPGDLRPGGDRGLESEPLEGLPRFGIQRYHVRVEIFGPDSEIIPRIRLQSLEAGDLPDQSKVFTTAVAALPRPLSVPSRVFGLTQIEPGPEAQASVLESLSDWYRRGLAFSRLTLLKDHLDQAGTQFADLEWVGVELGIDQLWSTEGAAEGDLLRVGNRWVILLQDQGSDEILDRDDLCLDFDKGARIRVIGEVFTGEGLVEWAKVLAN